MTDLQQVLREATDHLASPDLAGRALAAAHRTRVRRASAGALAAVVLLGGGVAWAVQDPVPHADVVDTPGPTPTPSTTPSVVDTDPATQEIWDPFTVVDAPRRSSVLPDELSPPSAAPSIADAPLSDIVVAWPEEGEDLRLLASSGDWRSVPGTATAIQGSLYDVVKPAISPGGDRVAMATDAGILVVEAGGAQQVVPWPPELAGPFDTRPAVLWRPDDAGFVVMHWARPWLVDLEGNGEPAPFGDRNNSQVMVDPDTGVVRESRWRNSMIMTWDGDEVVDRVPRRGYGERFVTRHGLVAYTGSPGQFDMGVLKSGPIVLDPASGDILGYAPIRDRDSVYSDNGHLTAMGFLDEGTILLLVTPMDFRTMEAGDARTHLVAWDFGSGDFSLIASGGPGMRTIAVAPDLLGEVS